MLPLKGNRGEGKFALVDDEDFPFLSRFVWVLAKSNKYKYYVRSFVEGKYVFMHRLLANPPSTLKVDHIDGNTLNNTKENLRVCSQQQNCMNRVTQLSCSSKYKGVYWQKSTSKWVAQIGFNKKRITVGLFTLEKDAAIAYNSKAIELLGEFANLNIIDG